MPPKGRNSATPGPKPVRNTRPALNNGFNSSYGSRGVADLGAQMTTGRAQETHTHFQRVTRSASIRPQPAPVVREPTTSPVRSPSPRPDTGIIAEAGYDPSLLQRAPAAPPRGASAAPPDPMPQRERPNVRVPSTFEIMINFLPSYLPRLLSDAEETLVQKIAALSITFSMLACVFFTCLILPALAPLPAGNLSLHRDQFYRGLKSAVGVIDPLYLPDNITKPPDQATYNKLMFFKSQDMVRDTDELKTQVGLHAESISELRRLLPDALAVQQGENGTYIIPEIFWKALLDKIGNDGAAPLWDSFISGNKAKLDAMIRDSSYRDGSQSPIHSISQFEFESTLAANNKMHEDNMRLQFNNFKELVMHEAKKMADEGADHTLKKAEDMLANSVTFKISTQQISALALTNLVYNQYRLQNEVNYFSLGLGAVVDPEYTSNTASPNHKSWGSYLYSKVMEASVMPNPPANALTGWDEGTQCWCAAHGNGQYANAQLTVKLEHKIRPAQVIIEHIPPKGTRDIAAAPRRYQVWAQLSNKTEAVRVQNQLMQDNEYREYTFPQCGEPPRKENNWVCILTTEYDIHANNDVQAKYVHGENIVETNRIAVRVTENWGAKDHTCLYRVRVTGEEVESYFPENVVNPLWANRAEQNLDGQAVGRND